MEDVVTVKGLMKYYGGHKAVKGIDFCVKKGSFFAILGPNGAGKSSTLNVLSTIINADVGKIVIDGFDIEKRTKEVRKRIGVVFQNGVLDQRLSVKENLIVRGSLYGISYGELEERINKIAKWTGIQRLLARPYGNLSGGEKRRCDIARAFISYPSILILDEPTTGLDPRMRREIWEAIETIRKNNNTTVILTTHYMEEVLGADSIIIMKEGQIVAKGTPQQLRKTFSCKNMDDVYLTAIGGEACLNWPIEI